MNPRTDAWTVQLGEDRRGVLTNNTGAAAGAVKVSTTHTQMVLGGAVRLEPGDSVRFVAGVDEHLAVSWTDLDSGETRVRIF